MGSGDQKHHGHHLSFHLHIPHLHCHHYTNGASDARKGVGDIPKGYLAIMVGQGEDELQRFIIPVIYINHPLFMQLLKEAEEEYGFDHNGPITIPCHVEQFRHVQDIIDKETHDHHQDAHHHNNLLHHHHHHHHLWCFRV